MPQPLYDEADYHRRSTAPGVSATREPGRSPFKKDYGRLLHAPAFRRLQGKTQLFPGHESDFFRNRLTHSLEVAQIASGIADTLNTKLEEDSKLDIDLVEFAALAHDLGHPPFGHNGEKALDLEMRQYGGFEGNAQSLHILAHVEKKLIVLPDGKRVSNFGLDLCYRSLASVLKYDQEIPFQRDKKATLKKGYYANEAELVLEIKNKLAPGYVGEFKTLECQIMDLADDIAYSTYDLEDSFHAGFLTPLSFIDALTTNTKIRTIVLDEVNKSLAKQGYNEIGTLELLERAAGIFGEAAFVKPELPDEARGYSDQLQNALIAAQYFSRNEELGTNRIERTSFTAQRVGRLIGSIELEPNTQFPKLSKVHLTRDAMLDVEIPKHLNFELIIRSSMLRIVEARGAEIVHQIFEDLRESNGDLLPTDWKAAHDLLEKPEEKMRLICDFIAGMTDSYALKFHSAIRGDGMSIFHPL